MKYAYRRVSGRGCKVPFDTLYILFHCISTLFYIILNLSACPDTAKGDGWPLILTLRYMSGEGGDHNGDMGFVFCMRLIYRWTSQVVLGNLGIRYEAPKKEVTAPAKDSGYFY